MKTAEKIDIDDPRGPEFDEAFQKIYQKHKSYFQSDASSRKHLNKHFVIKTWQHPSRVLMYCGGKLEESIKNEVFDEYNRIFGSDALIQISDT